MIITQGGTLSTNLKSLSKRPPGQRKRLVGQARYTETRYLPLDAEHRMVRAVRFSSHLGAPINTLLNINAAHLQRIG